METRDPLDWGLELARIAVPMVLFASPETGAIVAAHSPEHVEVITTGAPHPSTADEKLLRLQEVCRNRPRGEHHYWADMALLYQHLSFEFLYSDLLARAVARFAPDLAYFTMPGYDASAFFGGPTERLTHLSSAHDRESAATAPLHPVPGAGFRSAFGNDPRELNLPLAGIIDEHILHVAGDSHVLSGFTCNRAIGCRSNVLVRTREMCATAVPYAYQFTHHLGGRTMHHAGRPGALVATADQCGIRDGDAVVWVFGEIDIRCHILKQHREAHRPLDEIIATLAGEYIREVCAVAERHPRLRQVVFAPIPPLDNPDYRSVDLPVYGSIDERIDVTRRLRAVLGACCAAHDIGFLDVSDAFETPRGDLRWELSDRFCHISSTYQRPIVERLYRLLASG